MTLAKVDHEKDVPKAIEAIHVLLSVIDYVI